MLALDNAIGILTQILSKEILEMRKKISDYVQ